MIFPLCKWYFDINWHKFEKRWAVFFQIYPNAIRLNPLQFCPSMPLFGFPVFCLSSSIVLNRYFHILVNSMTIWSVLKLPKIAWPSPFNSRHMTRSVPIGKRICHGWHNKAFVTAGIPESHLLNKLVNAILKPLEKQSDEKESIQGKFCVYQIKEFSLECTAFFMKRVYPHFTKSRTTKLPTSCKKT